MKLQDFLQLDYTGQMSATSHGICVAGRDENKFKILLYQLNDFYIEVYYHKIYSFISKFVAFDAMNLPEHYLERIAIPVLD